MWPPARKKSFTRSDGAVFQKENVDACKHAICDVYKNIDSLKSVTERIKQLGDKFSTKEQAKEYFRIAVES